MTRREQFENNLLDIGQSWSVTLDKSVARTLTDEMARRLKVRPKPDYHNTRTDVLHELVPNGTSYEEVQAYKDFIDKDMQRRVEAQREWRKGLKSPPLSAYKDDIH